MQFDWTTFALELLNFLVLVWLLHRLLYRPVLGAIDRRKAGIEESLAEAAAARTQAEKLRSEYEGRLGEWAREKEAGRARLADELDADRTRRLGTLQRELAQEREKNRVLEERRIGEAARLAEREARAKGTALAASLLERLASPALEQTIFEVFLEDLAALPEPQLDELRLAARDAAGRAVVTSRYRLPEAAREALTEVLGRAAARAVTCEFREEPALVAGLRVALGACLLQASLHDELEFFTGATASASV